MSTGKTFAIIIVYIPPRVCDANGEQSFADILQQIRSIIRRVDYYFIGGDFNHLAEMGRKSLVDEGLEEVDFRGLDDPFYSRYLDLTFSNLRLKYQHLISTCFSDHSLLVMDFQIDIQKGLAATLSSVEPTHLPPDNSASIPDGSPTR